MIVFGAEAQEVAVLDERVDHVRGTGEGQLILEYGDFQCPCSRAAYRAVQDVERSLSDRVRFAFRHLPLLECHPHTLAASRAAEAAARQGCFWEMSELLFDRQEGFLRYGPRSFAIELGLDLAAFDADRTSGTVLARVVRDIRSGSASSQVHGRPALFVDGVRYRGSYDAASLLGALGA